MKIKGSRFRCSDYIIQSKAIYIIRTMQGRKRFDFSEKTTEYLKAEIDELNLTVRSKISETYIEVSMTLKGLPA